MSHVHCTNCDYDGKAKNVTPGNVLIEIILWCTFLVPGLIYSIWRLSNSKKVCPVCKWEYIVPIIMITWATPLNPPLSVGNIY